MNKMKDCQNDKCPHLIFDSEWYEYNCGNDDYNFSRNKIKNCHCYNSEKEPDYKKIFEHIKPFSKEIELLYYTNDGEQLTNLYDVVEYLLEKEVTE